MEDNSQLEDKSQLEDNSQLDYNKQLKDNRHQEDTRQLEANRQFEDIMPCLMPQGDFYYLHLTRIKFRIKRCLRFCSHKNKCGLVV